MSLSTVLNVLFVCISTLMSTLLGIAHKYAHRWYSQLMIIYIACTTGGGVCAVADSSWIFKGMLSAFPLYQFRLARGDV